MTAIQMTWHAEKRRVELGFTMEEVEAVALQPELVYPGDARQGHDRTVLQRGVIASVHSRDGTIITLMPSGIATRYARWEHQADCRGREHGS